MDSQGDRGRRISSTDAIASRDPLADSSERPLPPIPGQRSPQNEDFQASILPHFLTHPSRGEAAPGVGRASENAVDISGARERSDASSTGPGESSSQNAPEPSGPHSHPPTPSATPRSRRSTYQNGHSDSSSSGESSTLDQASLTVRPRHVRDAPRSTPSPPAMEFVVPRWQQDAEVTICPICRTQFSFFVRKHHCRKCGRVVCNSCSPHRITIPYQYIVQPPSEAGTMSARRPTLEGGPGSSTDVQGLGGGERVRLCNPCVPDPNTAPPQIPEILTRDSGPSRQSIHSRSASAVAPSPSGPYRPTSAFDAAVANFPARRPHGRQSSSNVDRPNRTSRANTSARDEPRGDARGALYRNEELESRSRSNTVGHMRDNISVAQFLNLPSSSPNQRLPQPSSQQQYYRPLVPPNDARPLPQLPRPVRRIPEEDECWVCHNELPSRTLPDFETLRAKHVEACIASAMGTSPTPAAAPPPISPTPRPFVGESSSSPQVPTANTPEARMAAREQAHAAVVLGRTQRSPSPVRRTGVFPYQATEKDCVDDAECTICLEEFEVGVEMGRLECFCRFHLKCIRDWFEQKPGQCPIHKPAGY